MRIGNNPQRDKLVNKGKYLHQVIMPIYIPELSTYYTDSFEVFKLSILSLIKTVHHKTYITVVANGCCKEVENYINQLYQNKQIHEVIYTSAIGKVNAILKGLAGSLYPIVTITDADVLFLNTWQDQTYQVFNNFPKCGVVSPVPNPSNTFYKNADLFASNSFNKKLYYSEIKNKEALREFAKSINELEYYERCHLKQYLVIKNNSFNAVVGSGHFIATYKTDLFNSKFTRFTKYLLGGNSVNNIIDSKASIIGFWRLSTEDNFAYHMGNTLDKTYIDIYIKIEQDTTVIINFPNTEVAKPSIFRVLYLKIINRVFESSRVKKMLKEYWFK